MENNLLLYVILPQQGKIFFKIFFSCATNLMQRINKHKSSLFMLDITHKKEHFSISKCYQNYHSLIYKIGLILCICDKIFDIDIEVPSIFWILCSCWPVLRFPSLPWTSAERCQTERGPSPPALRHVSAANKIHCKYYHWIFMSHPFLVCTVPLHSISILTNLSLVFYCWL